MDTIGTAKAILPLAATITIVNRMPDLNGKIVEVTPNGGRVHFQNEDDKAYRLRLWKQDDEKFRIDILLPAGGRVSVMINKDQEFEYRIVDFNDPDDVKTGAGGGGIRN
jgi:hypothetical protein